MGDNIYNLPIDDKFNTNENDMKLVSFLFKNEQPDEEVTHLNTINKNKSEKSFSSNIKDVLIATFLFALLSLPQITPVFDRIVGEDKPMYSLLVRCILFIILYFYIKLKL